MSRFLEPLENRTLLAGDVTAGVFGGVLIVRGDNQDNVLTIEAGARRGEFIFTGEADTRVNGKSDPVTLRGVKRGVLIHLRGGDDQLTLHDLELPRGLFIHGGSGADVIELDDVVVNGIAGIHSGGQSDQIALTDSTFNRLFRLNTGRGADSITLQNVEFRRDRFLRLGDRHDVITHVFDFRDGQLGWEGGFADYPDGPVAFDGDGTPLANAPEAWGFEQGLRSLPDELGDGTGFLLTGQNSSDDLFMFLKRRLGRDAGVHASQGYRVSFEIVFGSLAPSGCFGIGGSPGENVWLKAGASTIEPKAVLNDGFFEMNVDKGNQSSGGRNASVAGDVANGIPCDDADHEDPQFVSVTRQHEHPEAIRADEAGNLWLLIGTDSGFEGRSTLYYQRIAVTLTPTSAPSFSGKQ